MLYKKKKLKGVYLRIKQNSEWEMEQEYNMQMEQAYYEAQMEQLNIDRLNAMYYNR